ncbi:tRNA (cytidine(34)-2'-O)-methyltransferase [Mycoplasma marinum]|uniref:Putative tRNA (cytidine(34)-2'-O)-methyltransferase n=1 Tax=Mycoplasma marinum TaxID=1937190 RepID=A0A4R0XML2_9MOLU|nr:tRNA (cytidine(34)-2'-O)-methyltransferase [Mycoplasma marinum]TCG10702.1 RNA methyltransferase [Mycoplasma marinum]
MLNVVLYQPEISPNTGNIIRTCSAVGAKLHIIRPIAFELRPKYLKRPAAGRLLSDIEHEVHDSYEEFEKKYGNETIYYITRYGQQYHSTPDYSKHEEDIFIMFGRESTGIPKEIMRKKLDMCVRIPMVAHERSLNLANTVMLISYEISRQRNYEGLSKFEVQKGKDWILK